MSPRLEELRSVCVCTCAGGRSSFFLFFFKVREGGKENGSKHICPRFVCSYNTKPQHGPVQISSECTTAACRYSCQTLGRSLSPRYDGSPRLGNTNIDSVGINKQVADAWITAWAAAVRRSQGNQESIRLAAQQTVPSSCDHLSSLEKHCDTNLDLHYRLNCLFNAGMRDDTLPPVKPTTRSEAVFPFTYSNKNCSTSRNKTSCYFDSVEVSVKVSKLFTQEQMGYTKLGDTM